MNIYKSIETGTLNWVPLYYSDGTPIKGAELPGYGRWLTLQTYGKSRPLYNFRRFCSGAWEIEDEYEDEGEVTVLAWCRDIPGPTLPTREDADA